MRWFDREKTESTKHGDERIVVKFAILPVTIGKETRWLEKVAIHQTYSGRRWSTISERYETGLCTWVNTRFTN